MALAAVIEPRRTLLVHLVSLGMVCFAWNLPAQTNGVLREVFTGIKGGAVSDLTSSAKFPNSPDESYLEGNFEAPSNFSDYYGQRMRALLLPPVTGTYVFWLATDDGGALFLSTDESPAHKVQIASESLLNQLETTRPSAKLIFSLKFLEARKRGDLFIEPTAKRTKLHPCPKCGQPTSKDDLCSFCRMIEKANSSQTTENM